MRSFIFLEGSWSPADSFDSHEVSCFEIKNSISNSIKSQLSKIKEIRSADQYNEFVEFARGLQYDSSIISSPLRVIHNFRYTQFMKKEIFHMNLMQKKLSQLYCFDNGRKDVLVCFCGDRNALNIHLSIFHATFSRLFGAIAYIYKRDRNAIYKNIETIPAIALTTGRLNFLGCSGGAHLPLLLKLKYPMSGVLSFSPVDSVGAWNHLTVNLTAGINPQKLFNSCWSQNTKVYYSSSCKKDEYFAQACRSFIDRKVYDDVFVDIAHLEKSHTTLQTVFCRGLLGELIEDLCFEES